MIKQPLVISGTNIHELSAGDYLAGMLGELRTYSGMDTPHGWLTCMGQTLAISNYPELFGVIGSQFGGDGVSDFCLPNHRSAGTSRRIIYTGRYPQIIKSMRIPATLHGPTPGYYKAGAVLSFAVQLLDDTAVTGGPVSLIISIGGTAHTLALSSGTARDWVFASYTVQSGDTGDVTASLNLNGAALSSAGVAATLSVNNTTVSVSVDTTEPIAPTVNALTTTNTTPTITGTATVSAGETLTVTVNGMAYTVGDGNLALLGTEFTLAIPASNALTTGTYNVTATVVDAAGNAASDSTSAELVITPEA